MEFRLLGPVEVVAAQRVVDVGPPQRCAVLAALAVDVGRPVLVETLIDRVWGDQPPERVRRGLHAHVTRIRRILEQAGPAEGPPARLLRRPGGYLLDADPDRVDLHRFRRLYDRARDPAGVDGERVRLLRDALGLWRGEPLAGVAGSWAQRTRQGWRQRHLDAVRAWACAELAVDNPGAVIEPLTDLVGEHPLLEPLVAVLMRALYAVGRPTDALDLYTSTRDRLVEELGAEPGTELRRIQQGVLRADLDRADRGRAAPGRAGAPAVPVPAQLPRDVRGFAGRRPELAQLDAVLDTLAEPGAPVVVTALAGTAGVGKTALAVHWAHRVAARFPDGQLYVNLRGFDSSASIVDPADAVRRFLDDLGVDPGRIPADPDAQAALYRSELSGRRALLVLDNARDTAQVRPLLPGAPDCLVLVTSRNQLTGLIATDAARPVPLDLLAVDEARALLAGRLGPDRLAADPRALDEIVTRCARLPLALSIVAAHAATHPHVPLGTFAAELRDSRDRLDTLTTDDPHTDLRAVFSWSYRALSPPAGRLFRLLGLHPGPDISAAAAASLAGLPADRTRSLLAELAGANLLVEHSAGRYTFHDLLRAYATDLAHRLDGDDERRAATHRTLDHYLHTAFDADRLLEPVRSAIALDPPRPGVTPERCADHDGALAWFTAEHDVLLAAVERAVRAGFDTHVWQLAWTLVDYFYRRGLWRDWVPIARAAVAATERLGDPVAQAQANIACGSALLQSDQLDEAGPYLRRGLELSDQVGDRIGQARAHFHVAWLAETQGRNGDALHSARQALELYRAVGDRRLVGRGLGTVGWYHALVGDHEDARISCERAIAVAEEVDDRHGQAHAWDTLGYAHRHLGRPDRAVDCYRRALALFRELGLRYNEGVALMYLGDTHRAAGDPDAARTSWRQALAIFDDIDHPDAAKVRTRLAEP